MNFKISTAIKTLDRNFEDLKIKSFLEDNKVTEILITTERKIYIKKLGIGFMDTEIISKDEIVMNILNILASLNEISINDEHPYISTELPQSKNRVEGLIPPVVAVPKFNLRKKIPVMKTLENYLEDKFIDEKIYNYLKTKVIEKKNIMIVGGTDTGKTTFANALISVIDGLDERTIIIEEVEELQTKGKNIDRIKIIPDIYSSKQALKSCMRLSPERIIFGEVRGEEAYDLINGFNSGHSGGISTIHANDGLGGLKKLEMYIQMAVGKPLSEMIGMTVDVLITLKFDNKKRYLDEIVEVQGFDYLNKNYKLQKIYKKGAEL